MHESSSSVSCYVISGFQLLLMHESSVALCCTSFPVFSFYPFIIRPPFYVTSFPVFRHFRFSVLTKAWFIHRASAASFPVFSINPCMNHSRVTLRKSGYCTYQSPYLAFITSYHIIGLWIAGYRGSQNKFVRRMRMDTKTNTILSGESDRIQN